MRRLPPIAAAVAVVVLAVLAGAGPASAHEEISPYTVPTGRPAYLVLSVANEKRVDLTRVTISAATGGLFGHASRDPSGWTSTLSHTEITWTGGAVKPNRFESFGFDIESLGQPGTFTYKVNLAYSDGTSSQADVPVTAVGPDTVAVTPTTTAAAHEHEGEEAAEPEAATDATGESRANLALGLSGFALVAAIGAFIAGRRTAPKGEGQDW